MSNPAPDDSTLRAALVPSSPERTEEQTGVVAAERPCGILVVEADPNAQSKLARSLTIEGNRVVGTSSGDGALALVNQWAVDVALIADDLPGMNCLEVVARLRALRPDAIVLLMLSSDNPLEDPEVAARLAGAHKTLRKPFQVSELKAHLASLPLPPGVRAPVSAE